MKITLPELSIAALVRASNVTPEGRKPLFALARQYYVIPVPILLDLPQDQHP
jgi:predicted kinase